MARCPISPHGTSPSQPCCVLRAGRQAPAQVNIQALWGGSNPLAAFWKDEGFTSLGLLVSQKGVGRLTFHPCFFTSAFSLLLSGWGVSSNCFAPPQRQPQRLQWVSNCYRDHLQSFGILLPPQA